MTGQEAPTPARGNGCKDAAVSNSNGAAEWGGKRKVEFSHRYHFSNALENRCNESVGLQSFDKGMRQPTHTNLSWALYTEILHEMAGRDGDVWV